MFGLGVAGARSRMATRIPAGLVRGCGLAALGTIVLAPVVALLAGIDDLAADSALFLGGWYWQALLLAAVEATLVVSGSVWLVGFAQRRFTGSGPVAVYAARASFAAFVLQSPVLIALAVALRPLAAPAEIKAPLVGASAVLVCFMLGHLLVTRTPLGKIL